MEALAQGIRGASMRQVKRCNMVLNQSKIVSRVIEFNGKINVQFRSSAIIHDTIEEKSTYGG